MQRGPEAAREAFGLVPESVVRDMTAWLRWAAEGTCWLAGCLCCNAVFGRQLPPASCLHSPHPERLPLPASRSFLIYSGATDLLGGMARLPCRNRLTPYLFQLP